MDQRPLLPNMSETRGGQAPRHRAASSATRFEKQGRGLGWIGPPVSAASACCACLAANPEGRTHSLFTMSNNWLAQRQATLRPEAERCASRRGRWRILCGADGLESRGVGRRIARPCHSSQGRSHGGARRDRTDDLMLAKHALYRLSYCPSRASRVVGLGRLELPTSRLSSARSNQLSYKPEAILPKENRPIRWKKEKRRRRRPAKWVRDLGPVI